MSQIKSTIGDDKKVLSIILKRLRVDIYQFFLIFFGGTHLPILVHRILYFWTQLDGKYLGAINFWCCWFILDERE